MCVKNNNINKMYKFYNRPYTKFFFSILFFQISKIFTINSALLFGNICHTWKGVSTIFNTSSFPIVIFPTTYFNVIISCWPTFSVSIGTKNPEGRGGAGDDIKAWPVRAEHGWPFGSNAGWLRGGGAGCCWLMCLCWYSIETSGREPIAEVCCTDRKWACDTETRCHGLLPKSLCGHWVDFQGFLVWLTIWVKMVHRHIQTQVRFLTNLSRRSHRTEVTSCWFYV